MMNKRGVGVRLLEILIMRNQGKYLSGFFIESQLSNQWVPWPDRLAQGDVAVPTSSAFQGL